MDYGTRKQNRMAARTVEPRHRQAALRAFLICRGEPLAVTTDGAFAQLRSDDLGDAAFGGGREIQRPQSAAAREHQFFAPRMERRTVWMDGPAPSELARFTGFQRDLE